MSFNINTVQTGTGLRGRIGCASAVLLLAAGCSGPTRDQEEPVSTASQTLIQSGGVRVSVVLRGGPAASASARAGVARALKDPRSKVVHNFKAGLSLYIASQEDLDSLANNPEVERYGIVPELSPHLNESRGLVGADEAFAAGFTGAGRRVALIDTGAEATHDDLEDDVVDEACFCESSVGTGCCPNGATQQFGAGAAADLDGHGTHVSGIMTSAGGIAPRGVAPDAELIAIRVLSGGSFDDVTAGLEWLEANHPEIDAVNLSLGARFSTFPDDCDLQPGADAFIINMANAIHALRDDGVLTVAAAGNHGDKTQVTVPACISEVLSVGATDKQNDVRDFSNSSAGLDILATGAGFDPALPPTYACATDGSQCILSAGLGNGTRYLEGTSMAAPHVTAAISLLREAEPDLTPDEIEACLLGSPTQITDPVSGFTDPLLDIPAALEMCGFPLCNAQTYEAESIFHSTGGPVTGGWNIWSNGYISTNHTFTAGPSVVTVRARGQSANGVAPHMVVRVGGVVIGNVSVPQTTFTPFTFPFNATGANQEIRVTFDNDFYQPPQDRNLIVDNIAVSCAGAQDNPCEGLCENPAQFSWTGSYQGQNLGTGAICRETTQPVVGGNCGNFAGGRTLSVNGVTMPCNNNNWASIPAPRNGGYCVQTTAGDHPWAFVTLW